MSQSVIAYYQGKQIATTDICAGDTPEMKCIFWDMMKEHPSDSDDSNEAISFVTKTRVQQTIIKLEEHEAPLWQDFLTKLLPYDLVKISVR